MFLNNIRAYFLIAALVSLWTCDAADDREENEGKTPINASTEGISGTWNGSSLGEKDKQTGLYNSQQVVTIVFDNGKYTMFFNEIDDAKISGTYSVLDKKILFTVDQSTYSNFAESNDVMQGNYSLTGNKIHIIFGEQRELVLTRESSTSDGLSGTGTVSGNDAGSEFFLEGDWICQPADNSLIFSMRITGPVERSAMQGKIFKKGSKSPALFKAGITLDSSEDVLIYQINSSTEDSYLNAEIKFALDGEIILATEFLRANGLEEDIVNLTCSNG